MARHTPKISDQILEEASSWFIDFHEGERTAADREEFTTWLRRSPEHVQAYLEISAFWEDAEALKKPGQAQIETLVARAKAEHNVVPLERPLRADSAADVVGIEEVHAESGTHAESPVSLAVESVSDAISTPRPRTRRPHYLALAASILIAAIGTGGAWLHNQRDTYATSIGEQRSITLEDGSSVELNSRSRLKVRFTDTERRIELLEGQALFRVAKNPARPFIVRSDDTSVRAVGTQFDVYRKSGGTIVTVLEGQVAVVPVPDTAFALSGSAVPTQFLVSAGEQISITPELRPEASELRPTKADIATATAWTDKKLIFNETPLREVVEEFNRYNRQPLVIGDPELYEFHISGVFPSTDSSRMLEFLKQRFGVTWTDSQGEKIIISRTEQDSIL